MARNRMQVVGAALLALLLPTGGCATALSLSDPLHSNRQFDQRRPYEGVILDGAVALLFLESPPFLFFEPLVLCDLVLSAAAETVLLPPLIVAKIARTDPAPPAPRPGPETPARRAHTAIMDPELER